MSNRVLLIYLHITDTRIIIYIQWLAKVDEQLSLTKKFFRIRYIKHFKISLQL